MAPEFNKKLQQIYDEALELPRSKRKRFLEFACADSAELQQAVIRLLESRGEWETAPPPPIPTMSTASAMGATVVASAMTSTTSGRLRMEKISRYVIKGELGKGAMGAVYEAVDPMIGRTVALKVLLSNMADEDEAKSLEDRLFREASSAGRLAHPGIVTVFDVGKEGEMAFIAMERVEGPTLQQMMKERKIDRQQTLEILRQAAAAMDYAHAEGIIHRDIKPANIMLHKGAQAKIADFGIAKVSAMSQLTVAGTILGTPSYMSPEQIQNLTLTGTSDQFSLAVVAYEMLTGTKPFERETMPALLLAIVTGERPSASKADPTLPVMVDEVFQMALNRAPERRFGSCTAFINALAGSLGVDFSAYSAAGSGIHAVVNTPLPASPPPVSSITGPRVAPPPPFVLPPPPAYGQKNQKAPSQGGLYIVGGLVLVAALAAYPIYKYVYQKPVALDKDKAVVAITNNSGNDATKKEEIIVPPVETKVAAPTVSTFTAEPEKVKPGGTTTIRWWVTDSVDISIEPGIGKVDPKGSAEVKPRKDTEYTLKATGVGGEVTAKVTVAVGAEEPARLSTKTKTPETPAKEPAKPETHADPARAQQLYDDGVTKHKGQPGSAAVASFEEAAALGEPRAMLELGKIYSAGDGVSKDATKAAGWYRKAADLGNASAMVFLGALYAQGSGVPRDMLEAAKWIRKSADAGNAVAMDGLGQMYANGQGLPVDLSQAVVWYRKGVDGNSAAAMYHLGLILENGSGPVAKNAAEAAQLFQRSANAGYAPAKAKASAGGGSAAAGGFAVMGIDKGGLTESKSQLYRLNGSGLSAGCTVTSESFSSIGSRDGQYDHKPTAAAPDGSWLAVYISLPPQLGKTTVKLTVKNPAGNSVSLDVPVLK
jgi:serine/threonine protein kinase/TPR repeat protein